VVTSRDTLDAAGLASQAQEILLRGRSASIAVVALDRESLRELLADLASG
jgi:hypothetical protein